MRTRLRYSAIILLAFFLVTLFTLSLSGAGDKPYDAPGVSFKIDKKTVKLSDMKDNVVLVLFGRQGAEPTDEAVKTLATLAKAKEGKAVKTVFVNFMNKKTDDVDGIDVTDDDKGKIADEFKIDRLPCLYVIDKFQKVRHVGAIDSEKTAKLIDELIAEEKAGDSFNRDASPKLALGKHVAPLDLTSVSSKKKYNLYDAITTAEYSFVLVSETG